MESRSQKLENCQGDKHPDDRTTQIAEHEGIQSDRFSLYDEAPPEYVTAQTRYLILGELGRGGVGTVYRARDMLLPREIAVKVLHHKYCDRPYLVSRFLEEGRIISYLQHPGIAQIYEVGQCDDGRPFMAMKLVDGRNLFWMIHEPEIDKPELAPLINIFAQLCQTMSYVHSRGVVHLDLKPSNIMVGPYGEVHLMDWGLAKFLSDLSGYLDETLIEDELSDQDLHFELSPKISGTVQYMSPEQARGEAVDKRSDVFGLGSILCEILTGKPPYFGEDKRQVFMSAKHGATDEALVNLEQVDTDCALVRLAKSCLNPNPDDRPSDASEVALEVAKYHQSALERVESDMTRFFELSHDLFCIAGLDGFFRRINSNFSRVLGYDEEALLSQPFIDLVHPDDRERTVAQMEGLQLGRPVVRFRNRYRRADGGYVEFEWTAKSIPRENIIFAVARNVSE